MRDHVIVAEGPQNDERALAVIGETRRLVPGKPIRYVIASHNHFDHTGGLRAFASEGVTVITHEVHRAFFERALAAPATIAPDHLAKSGKKGMVEGVRDRRVLTDGARTVELRHIVGNGHDDGLLMVYLPAEKLVIEADVFTPLAPNAPPPTPVSPFSVNLADNIAAAGAGGRPDPPASRPRGPAGRALPDDRPDPLAGGRAETPGQRGTEPARRHAPKRDALRAHEGAERHERLGDAVEGGVRVEDLAVQRRRPAPSPARARSARAAPPAVSRRDASSRPDGR